MKIRTRFVAAIVVILCGLLIQLWAQATQPKRHRCA